MAQLDDLDKARLDVANKLSSRSRRVLLLLHVFTLTVAIAALNADSNLNWFDRRYAVRRTAYHLLVCAQAVDTSHELVADIGSTQEEEGIWDVAAIQPTGHHRLRRNALRWRELCLARIAPTIPAGEDAEESLSRGLEYLRYARPTARELKSDIDALADDMRDAVWTVRVPAVDTRLDVNWLGPVAGAGHILLLLWLGISLAQEVAFRKVLERKYAAHGAPVQNAAPDPAEVGKTLLELIRGEEMFSPASADSELYPRAAAYVFGMGSLVAPLLVNIWIVTLDRNYRDLYPVYGEDILSMLPIFDGGSLVMALGLTLWCAKGLHGLIKS